jgi:sarcosine oxidase subunit beta
MATAADVIIVGGGVHGASLAFHLAQRGLKPLVLERKFVAAGATGRSSGLVRMHYDLRLECEQVWKSFEYFRNWDDVVGGSCGFVRTGFIRIVPPAYEDALRANVAMQPLWAGALRGWQAAAWRAPLRGHLAERGRGLTPRLPLG